jgi:hypothetical protein
VRVIDGDELHTRVHERRDKGEVAGQAIELGNDELGFLFPAGRERLLQLRPVIALAALDLRELADEVPPTAVEIVKDRLPLRLKAQS